MDCQLYTTSGKKIPGLAGGKSLLLFGQKYPLDQGHFGIWRFASHPSVGVAASI
jgi:hypothetical protein